MWNIEYVEYAEFNGDVHFLPFLNGHTAFGEFIPKNESCQYKLKFYS